MSRRLLHIVLVLLLFTSCGHRSQEMSEALLRAEEMNRNYQSMDTLKGMEQVADYYRPFLGRSQRYMRALYILGCVYRDRGDAPMALHYYQEAVSQADTTDAMPIATSIPSAESMGRCLCSISGNAPLD